MVNMTESFTKLYGRPPTEQEIATMWKMKREQEGYRKEVIKQKTSAKKLKEPKLPKSLPKDPSERKWPYRASKTAKVINRLLIIQTRIDDIAYALGLTENFVMSEIERWKLPQNNDK